MEEQFDEAPVAHGMRHVSIRRQHYDAGNHTGITWTSSAR